MRRLPRLLVSLLVTFAFACAGRAALSDFAAWPAGQSPAEIGRRVAARFIASPHPNFGRETPPPRITYPEACTWYGALEFAHVTGDAALLHTLAARFEPLLGAEQSLVPAPEHVDYTVFASVPLELAMLLKEQRYLALGEWMAEKQWDEPFGPHATPEAWEYHRQGLSWQTRLWIDDMFMITIAQTQAYRATGLRRYVDRAAKEMVYYLDRLQQPTGLFYHAPDVPFYWGRGDGWVAAGMSELLRSLPADHPDRPRILDGYHRMMAALLKYQDASGMWHQLIDDPASWPETSCTGMFTFAFITGVKAGWLDEPTYGPAARRAWLALTGYLDKNADIRDVCQGTNKKNDRRYYLDRQRLTGDLHGQAPVLWCAAALLR
ncbi:MAG TPA: glycoside hydrolase family 88 protein [Lacunisphaera sp.]|jgi:rhamnogalacturonyl hydrolase YesR|nr:glycoside hydrolase family 88 protein [Lacunisphaera sp.]